MSKAKKGNLLLVSGLALTAVFSCSLGVFTLNENKEISASAATIEYQEYLGLEDRTSWASGGHADIVTLGLMDFSITEGNQYFKSSVSGCWYHGNDDVVPANNGLDILQYVYLNGESARDLITQNATDQKSTAGTTTWLSNPAAWPIAFETGTDCWIRIDKTKFGGNFTFTFKAGFSLIRNDGETVSISNDIIYTYTNGVLAKEEVATSCTLSFEGLTETKTVEAGMAIGELPAVPAKDGYIGFWAVDGVAINENTILSGNKTATLVYVLEYQEYLGIEDRTSWASGGHADIVALGLMDFSITEGNQYFKSSVSGCWYHGNDDVVPANNGLDILQYVYLNGESARDLITQNATDQKSTAGTTTWLSNPAAWPIAFETGTDCWIRIDKTKFGGDFTFTLKAGFSLIRNDGQMIALTDDLTYVYNNGVWGKDSYTLTFEGVSEQRKVKPGEAIGMLPAIPMQDGKIGEWQIDGKTISAETLYDYGANKTATIVYYEGVDISDTIDMDNWGGALGADSTYIRVGNWKDADNNLMMSTAFDNIHWQDHASTASENYGCDLMEYIYINGKSARAISTENGQTNAYGDEGKTTTFPFQLGGVYAPIDVFTSGNEFVILVMNEYFAGEELVITLKAGFRMATSDGEMLYLAKDFVFPYYVVTFDGEAQRVMPNETVAEPAAPTKVETESHTYAFDGWYNGEAKWDFSTPVTENLTLTAKFTATEKTKFTVSFHADNGSEDVSVPVYVNACIKAAQIPANPEKTTDGALTYTFLYWSLDGANAFDFNTPITENITLTAVYTTETLYTVTMGETTQKVIEGGKVVKPADPTKESTAEFDYTFEGWYNGETKWDFENDVVTSDIELTAKYTETKRSYTISFNVTGNDAISFESVVVEYGTVYDLSNLLDGKDVGDYKYAITVDGEAVTSVTVVSDVTVDVTFMAKAYYTVTIDGVEQTVEEGSKATKPETEPTKESTVEFDFVFDGWYNGETKWDFENDVVTGNLELVAKYTEITRKYTVSFNVTGNDAITLDPVEVEYGTNYDLSKLLEGKDVTDYTYSISVNGVEKAGIKVVGDTTVDVVFTKKANDDKKSDKGCGSVVSGAMGAIVGILALGAMLAIKKKED